MKRIKTVFSSPGSCAERYVKQAQAFGRSMTRTQCSAGCNARWQDTRIHKCDGDRVASTFFRGRDFFSYGDHFLVARMGLKLNGVAFAVLNTHRYSVSTNAHIWAIDCQFRDNGIEYIQIDSSDAREGISDARLVELARDSIETRQASLQWQVATMEKQCGRNKSTWRVSDLKDRIRAHNKQCAKLKLPKLAVAIDDRKFRRAISMAVLVRRAKRDGNSRRQVEISFYDVLGRSA